MVYSWDKADTDIHVHPRIRMYIKLYLENRENYGVEIKISQNHSCGYVLERVGSGSGEGTDSDLGSTPPSTQFLSSLVFHMTESQTRFYIKESFYW